MTEREVSSERDDAAFLRGMALAYATDDNEHSQKGAARLREIADNILALRSSVKTVGVPEAMELLRKALAADAQNQSRRNEMLATLIVNLEKAEPTAELAVALRDFVRRERPKLSAIEAPVAPSEVTEDAVFRAMTKADDLDIALCDDDAREILTATLKGGK